MQSICLKMRNPNNHNNPNNLKGEFKDVCPTKSFADANRDEQLVHMIKRLVHMQKRLDLNGEIK